MSVVRRNRTQTSALSNLGALVNALLGSGLIDPYKSAWDAGQYIGKTIADTRKPGWSPQPGGEPATGGRGRKGNNNRRRRGRERKNNPQSTDTFRVIGLGPTSGSPSLRTRLTGIITCTAGASGGTVATWWIGAVGTNLFANLSADAKKLYGAFEKMLVHRVTAKYVGTVATSVPGFVALGMDSSTDTSVVLPGTIQGLTDMHTHVVVCDIKGESSLTYQPKGTDQECRIADTQAPTSDQFAGKFSIVMQGSGLAAGAVFGLIHLAIDVTLIQ